MNATHWKFACLAALLGASCLPGDIRPEPGRVFVAAQASPASLEDFTTADGWAIHFDRLLVGLGYVLLAGEGCNDYGNARYDRLFDFKVPGVQKMGELYGLEACDVQFQLRAPSPSSYLQDGVTADDRTLMRKRYRLWFSNRTRTAAYFLGKATRGKTTKRFDWRFSATYTLTDCTSDTDGKVSTSLQLLGREDLRPIVMFHGEDLFRDSLDPEASLRFGQLASADANKDGKITLSEVAKVPAPEGTLDEMDEMDGGVADAGAADAGVEESKLKGWAQFMREKLLPRVFRYDGSPCKNVPWRSEVNEPEFEFEIDF